LQSGHGTSWCPNFPLRTEKMCLSSKTYLFPAATPQGCLQSVCLLPATIVLTVSVVKVFLNPCPQKESPPQTPLTSQSTQPLPPTLKTSFPLILATQVQHPPFPKTAEHALRFPVFQPQWPRRPLFEKKAMFLRLSPQLCS